MTSRPDADVEELTVKAAHVHRSLTQLRGRATSSDGEVTIEVSIDGRITKIVCPNDSHSSALTQWARRSSVPTAKHWPTWKRLRRKSGGNSPRTIGWPESCIE